MNVIAAAQQISKATPEAIFTLWSTVAHWPEWDEDIASAGLHGQFSLGSQGYVKPKGGPRATFTITEIMPNKSFTSVSHLPGARLLFSHALSREENHTLIRHTISISGRLAWLWSLLLGKSLRKGLQSAIDNLASLAEIQ